MSTILVTGAKGFIGSALLDELRKTEHTIIGTTRSLDSHCRLFKCDLSDEAEVRELFNFYDPDIIFHLAANPITDIKKTGIHRIWQDNIMSTKNLLDYAKPGSKFIFASSATVYSNESLQKGATEDDIPLPASFYGFSKYVSERLLEDYSKEKGLMGVSSRLIATVGKGSTHGVIHDLYKKYKSGKDVEIIGTPPNGTSKPFIHVDDVIKFFKIWVDKSFEQGYYNYNICNSSPDFISVGSICGLLREKLNVNPKETWTPTWKGDNTVVRILGRKAWNELEYCPQLYSRSAIEKTIQEYEENI